MQRRNAKFISYKNFSTWSNLSKSISISIIWEIIVICEFEIYSPMLVLIRTSFQTLYPFANKLNLKNLNIKCIITSKVILLAPHRVQNRLRNTPCIVMEADHYRQNTCVTSEGVNICSRWDRQTSRPEWKIKSHK